MAEWLRRWIANPLLFERESSNLSSVESFSNWNGIHLIAESHFSHLLHNILGFTFVIIILTPVYFSSIPLLLILRPLFVRINEEIGPSRDMTDQRFLPYSEERKYSFSSGKNLDGGNDFLILARMSTWP